jgi:hypothetical protein
MGADEPDGQTCFVCKKPRATIWDCDICVTVGRQVSVCSPRCRRVHERDGLHRREKRRQSTPA